MRIKNLLRTTIIICGAAVLILSYKIQSRTEIASADNGYVSRGILQGEIYYNEIDIPFEPIEYSNLYIEEKVIPAHVVGEKAVAGYEVCTTKVKITKEELKYSFTDEEVKILERIVEAECTGQNKESKMNVCSVIINRVESDEFPDDIESVVFEHNGDCYQFSPIKDGRYEEVEITKDTEKAVKKILQDGVNNDALFFCNINDVESLKNQRWFMKLEFLFKDDSKHNFYK